MGYADVPHATTPAPAISLAAQSSISRNLNEAVAPIIRGQIIPFWDKKISTMDINKIENILLHATTLDSREQLYAFAANAKIRAIEAIKRLDEKIKLLSGGRKLNDTDLSAVMQILRAEQEIFTNPEVVAFFSTSSLLGDAFIPASTNKMREILNYSILLGNDKKFVDLVKSGKPLVETLDGRQRSGPAILNISDDDFGNSKFAALSMWALAMIYSLDKDTKQNRGINWLLERHKGLIMSELHNIYDIPDHQNGVMLLEADPILSRAFTLLMIPKLNSAPAILGKSFLMAAQNNESSFDLMLNPTNMYSFGGQRLNWHLMDQVGFLYQTPWYPQDCSAFTANVNAFGTYEYEHLSTSHAFQAKQLLIDAVTPEGTTPAPIIDFKSGRADVMRFLNALFTSDYNSQSAIEQLQVILDTKFPRSKRWIYDTLGISRVTQENFPLIRQLFQLRPLLTMFNMNGGIKLLSFDQSDIKSIEDFWRDAKEQDMTVLLFLATYDKSQFTLAQRGGHIGIAYDIIDTKDKHGLAAIYLADGRNLALQDSSPNSGEEGMAFTSRTQNMTSVSECYMFAIR